MKTIVLFLGLLPCVTVNGHAQSAPRFGLKAGLALANWRGQGVSGTKSNVGFQVGGLARIDINDLLSLQPELLYSQKGYNSEANGLKTKSTLSYVDLPLLLRVNAGNLFFEAGPQLGYLVARNVTLSGTMSVTGSGTSGLSKFDAGYIAGLGYQFASSLNLGLRYNGGLTSVDERRKAKVYNSAFQLQVGYLFGGK